LIPAIAAILMITAMLSISVTGVSATHTSTATIDKDTVKGPATMVLTVTVGNAGPDPIENVRIVFPSGWSPAAVVSIPKDNLVDISEPTNDNLVIIPAGTVIVLDNENAIWLYENTEVLGLVNMIFHRDNAANENVENVKFSENARMQVRKIENLFAYENENIAGVIGLEVILDNGLLRLAEDTIAVRIDNENVWFPNGACVELIKENYGTTSVDNENVVLQQDVLVRKHGENVELRLLESVRGLIEGGPFTGLTVELLPATDENLTLYPENNLLIPAGTTAFIGKGSRVKLAENMEVTIPAENRAKMENAEAAENRPAGWAQDNQAKYLEWVGDENHQIAKGKSLDFPFAITTPSEGGDYTLYVRTKDTKGVIRISEITLTVDNIAPTVEIDVSPDWVKENTAVTITVTASEPLAKIENVLVAENNAPENTQITMTPNADNTVWTGTYTTGDNEERDGTAKVYVRGFEDLFGNEVDENTATFTVDRMAPPAPVLDEITGFPTSPTNVGEWLLENCALDNFRGVLENQKGMTVEIRVGDTTYTTTTATDGYWYYQLALVEGTNEVGIRLVDKAGNEGPENAENITYDATKPSVSMISPENGAYINDNTPTIKLTIADAVMGVENEDLYDENYGYSVLLCYDNDTPIDNLIPKTYPTSDPFKSFTFENDWPEELAENWYRIRVLAGDNLQNENIYIRFCVDVTAPSISVEAIYNPLSGTSLGSPEILKTTSVTISGKAEEDATIKVYVDGAEQTAARTTATDGTWDITVSLTGGVASKIEATATDAAGNESGKLLLGFAMPDTSAPTVTITSPTSGAETTEKSILIEGNVTKDTWEDYSDLTVTVQVGAVAGGTVTPDSTGHFSISATLTEGTNTIAVVAEDEIGNRGSAGITSILVTRVVTPWATYAAIILVIIALALAAIAIFRKR